MSSKHDAISFTNINGKKDHNKKSKSCWILILIFTLNEKPNKYRFRSLENDMINTRINLLFHWMRRKQIDANSN